MVGAPGFEPGASCAQGSCEKSILLIRLALFFVMVRRSGADLAAGSAGLPTPFNASRSSQSPQQLTAPSFCAYCREGFAAHAEARHGSLAATSLWGRLPGVTWHLLRHSRAPMLDWARR